MAKDRLPRPAEQMQLPVGIDESGMARVLKVDNQGRLEVVFASGVGIQRRQFEVYLAGTLAVVSGQLCLPNQTGANLTFEKVALMVGTAPSGQAIIVDVHKNNVTIFASANRPQIAAGAFTGESTTFATATWAVGEYLKIDVDQVGNPVAGANLTVVVVCS